MKTRESVNKDGKEKEEKEKAKTTKAPSPKGAGFGMARVTQQRDGTFLAEVKCVNGDPRRNLSTLLPAGITYHNSTEKVPNAAEISVCLSDGQTIDVAFIFPWTPSSPDPLRLGGGVVIADVLEGAQRMVSEKKEPIQAPFVKTRWVNGTPHGISFFLDNALGFTFYEGDVVFGLAMVDPVTAKPVMKIMALREGTCLDIVG